MVGFIELASSNSSNSNTVMQLISILFLYFYLWVCCTSYWSATHEKSLKTGMCLVLHFLHLPSWTVPCTLLLWILDRYVCKWWNRLSITKCEENSVLSWFSWRTIAFLRNINAVNATNENIKKVVFLFFVFISCAANWSC